MSYYLGTAPTSGPPGPLRVPGVQLGAVEPHTHACKCSLGDVGDGAKGLMTTGAIVLGFLWFVTRKKRG
jgi:hypothetical protein